MTLHLFVKFAFAAAAVCLTGLPALAQAASSPQEAVIAMGRSGGSYLGVGVAEITSDRARELKIGEERGVEITRVEDESPAAKAGLKQGDVVLEYNGTRVEGVEQFMRLVRETPVGREVKLSVNRAGSAQQVIAKTGSRKSMARSWEFSMPDVNVSMPPIRIDIPRANMTWRSSVLGIEGESLESQLAEYFGVKDGVLVRSVMKGSAAEKAGIKAGDVILKVDEAKVATPREITSAIRAAAKKSVTITASRDKREMTFAVPIEETAAPARTLRARPVAAHE